MAEVKATVMAPVTSLSDLRTLFDDLAQVPAFEQDPSLYRDVGDDHDFKPQVGRGECAQ